MNRNYIPVCCALFLILLISSCATTPGYRRITDGVDRKRYQVVGRVLDSFQRPVTGCQIYLTKNWPSQKEDMPGLNQNVPVAITSYNGDYSFTFELEDATKFYLYFDARSQGFEARYLDITYLFTSDFWQYGGTNPVIANAVLIPNNIAIENDVLQ